MVEQRVEHILVGVGGDGSAAAIGWAIERARQHPVAIELLRSYDPLRTTQQAEHDVLARARERVAAGAPGGTRIETALSAAAVAPALIDEAASADLLVVGSRRGHPFWSALAGSLPLTIAARSDCVTVVVPDDATPRGRGSVVVGASGDDTSAEALRFAVAEAADAGAELEVVHAWTATPASLDEVVPPDPASDLEAHRGLLDAAVAQAEASRSGLRVRAVLEERSPANAIADRAGRARLLVLGSHRRGPIAGLVLGSTARELLPLTSTPLCIVPPTVRPPRR